MPRKPALSRHVNTTDSDAESITFVVWKSDTEKVTHRVSRGAFLRMVRVWSKQAEDEDFLGAR